MATSEERSRELYGPRRSLARDEAQRQLTEDHVQRNLQGGMEQQSSHLAFQSETAQSFRKHSAGKLLSSLCDRSRWNPSAQNTTHIKLGSDSSPRTSVVRSDFTEKPTSRFQQIIPEGIHDINLADMVPRYMVDKSLGKSLYSADFDGDKSYREWSHRAASEGRKIGRRSTTTTYQKSTHFELGSDPPGLVSETSGCFTDKQKVSHGKPATSTSAGAPPLPPAAAAAVDVSRSTSNVFRSGDYDLPLHASRGHFLTVQQQDYQYRDRAPPAGVSTTTKKAYSHVLPRRAAGGPAVSALRQLLVEEHSRVFQNPRDPTSTNVTRAFLNYDKDRSGFITAESLRAVCKDLGTPISDQEIAQLMAECDQDGDGKISYVDFTKFLTSQDEAECSSEVMASTTDRTYSQPRRESGSDETESNPYMGAAYQDSTHFQFGDHHKNTPSVYTGDFNVESVRGAKRERAVSPPSSKVMHEFPVVSPDAASTTTSRKDFIRHDVTAMARQRRDALNTNRSRHERLAVEISCGKEKTGEHYTTTVMGSSYVAPPPGTQREGPVNPAPHDYRHLESNRALLQPPPGPPSSENKAQFVAPLKSEVEARERTRAAHSERTSRIQDNKHTHLVLGFHSSPPLSEKMAEFGEKKAVDSSLLAAGKPNGPTQGYSVLSHECGVEVEGEVEGGGGSTATGLQGLLQQRNFLKNVNPRDPLNINLRKAFLEYDKNLSGSVGAEDVRAVCKAMQVQVTEQALEELVAKCDKNEDGQIDYHEFALNLSRKQPPSASLSRPPHQPTTTTTRQDFRDPTTQRLTAIQQVVMEQDAKRYVPLQPTHFFHTDSRQDYLLSTTRKDYRSPAEVTD